MPCFLAVLLAFPAFAFSRPACSAPCPQNELSAAGFHALTTAAVYDTVLGTDDGYPVREGYDLITGALHVFHVEGLTQAVVKAADEYDVTGVPPGTAVPVTVEMSVTGWTASQGCGGSGCWGWLAGQIVTPADSELVEQGRNIFGPDMQPIAFIVQASLVLTAGTPAHVAYRFTGYQSPGGFHASAGDAALRFLGVPPGAVVTSCQGYRDPSTPALRRSWGSLKAAYR